VGQGPPQSRLVRGHTHGRAADQDAAVWGGHPRPDPARQPLLVSALRGAAGGLVSAGHAQRIARDVLPADAQRDAAGAARGLRAGGMGINDNDTGRVGRRDPTGQALGLHR